MKLLIILFSLSFTGLCLAGTSLYPRGCIYIMGRCSRECEVGTHAYTTGCNYLLPEATCNDPTPTLDKRGKICDFSACYCDPPTVRNLDTDECVPLDECPQ